MSDKQPFEILVVEDDQPTFDLLKRLGSQLFPEALFTGVVSAKETFDYLTRQPAQLPRLILLDIDLGQSVTGLALLPQLRRHVKGQIPIIMLTVSDNQTHIRQSYDTGATAFTRKPTDLSGWKHYIQQLKQ
ncbi:hypothetical protein GCM10028808_63640 [Spirosoma migulaei]